MLLQQLSSLSGPMSPSSVASLQQATANMSATATAQGIGLNLVSISDYKTKALKQVTHLPVNRTGGVKAVINSARDFHE